MKQLTLIVPYRNRSKQLRLLLEHYKQNLSSFADLLVVENDTRKKARTRVDKYGGKYLYFKSESDVFNKSMLINKGLDMIKTDYFCVYDVDLLPHNDALKKQLNLAKEITPNVVGAYRCNISIHFIDNPDYEAFSLGSELNKSALKRQLLKGEKHGVNPIFQTRIARDIKGFDEKFEGWGCEDRDFLERYMKRAGGHLLNSTDFVYYHLKHRNTKGWNDKELVDKNEEYYSQKRKRA